MKTLCFAALALFSASAFATTPDEMSACSIKSDLYAGAADMRDQNQSPQDAAKFLGAYRGRFISAEDFKNIINTVYFDDRFANAGGLPLKRQMLDECLNGPKQAYQPLQ
jgi:hypothetical protein